MVIEPESAPAGSGAEFSVLLVEDDHGDAVLVRACLGEAGFPSQAIVWTRTCTEAIAALADQPDCVLLDLGLPDAHGFGAVRQVVAAAPGVPVIVLTGLQERDGVDALSAGAQDYLAKDSLTGPLLQRSIRYAVERKRAEQAQQRLRLSAAEQARLERGLLPSPLLRTDALQCATYYRPGSDGAVLGGDFFDVVETRNGIVRAVIGDVMGHGPDEAALGVHLRVAWRTLLLAGTPDDAVLPTLARLLAAESAGVARFATLCDLTITPGRLVARVAGHPAPIVCDGGTATYLDLQVGPPLGLPESVRPVTAWPSTAVELRRSAAVVLYTDGLLDSYAVSEATGTLGVDELVAAIGECDRSGEPIERWISRLVGGAPRDSVDDTAAVVLASRPPDR